MKTLGLIFVIILIFLIGYYIVGKLGQFLDDGGVVFEDGPEDR